MQTVGRVTEVWRYPVKSMAGERLGDCRLTATGIPGDRAWALRDESAGEIRGGKKFPALMKCSARFLEEPAPGQSPPAEIVLPDGQRFRSDDPRASDLLTDLISRKVTLCPLRPAADLDHYRRGIPDNPDILDELREIFGRLAEEPLPDLSIFPPELMEFTGPVGTYFDAFPVHVVTTATLAEMKRRAPASNFDSRRFRPNFLIETNDEAGEGLVEAKWAGSRLKVGEAVLQIVMPTVRCSMITREQEGLAKDPGVLRAVVSQADQNLGAYAVVVQAGAVKLGDDVVLLDS